MASGKELAISSDGPKSSNDIEQARRYKLLAWESVLKAWLSDKIVFRWIAEEERIEKTEN